MTKQALCLQDLNDFNRLSDGEIQTIDFQFVDRAICEIPANGFFQLIPYVTFSYLDTPNGKLNYVIYRRPAKGEGEARLQGNSSLGFGGHIDSVTDLRFSESFTTEEGVTIYRMSLDDIKNTCMTCAKREMTEEVGFDPFEELQIENDNIVFGLEREQEPDEVGQVHVCISIKVNLDESRIAGFFEKAKAQVTEIEDLKTVSIDVSKFLASFNVAEAVKHMNAQLTNELQLEAWSTLVVNSMLTQLVDFMQRGWDFKAVMDALIENMRQKAEAAEQGTQDTPEGESQDALAAESTPAVETAPVSQDSDTAEPSVG